MPLLAHLKLKQLIDKWSIIYTAGKLHYKYSFLTESAFVMLLVLFFNANFTDKFNHVYVVIMKTNR